MTEFVQAMAELENKIKELQAENAKLKTVAEAALACKLRDKTAILGTVLLDDYWPMVRALKAAGYEIGVQG